MPSAERPGKKGIYVELDADLDAAFRAFVAASPLGSISQHVQMAIRRHMACPPTVGVPPLPPATLPAVDEPSGRPGRPPKGKKK